jgi:hypothetical protein
MFVLFVAALVCVVGAVRGECVPPGRPVDLSQIDTDLLHSLNAVHRTARGKWAVFSARDGASQTIAAMQDKFPNTTIYLRDMGAHDHGKFFYNIHQTCAWHQSLNNTMIILDDLHSTTQIMDWLGSVPSAEPVAVVALVHSPLVLADLIRGGLFFEERRGVYVWLEDTE